MKRLWRFFLDLLYPPKCACCETLLSEGSHYVCEVCQKRFAFLQGEDAWQRGKYFSRCLSVAWYEDVLRHAIHQYKFYGQKQLSAFFAPLLAERIAEHLAGQYDVITWIPVSKHRLKERGYDQCKLLAQDVAETLHQPLACLLAQPKKKKAQSSLKSDEERAENVKGCFSVLEGVVGKRILLLDDVITTGSTLEEGAKALLEAGAREVLCVTVCRARG